ncbi:MAG: PaaI family thioesterase [Actinobacteria bacterium]|nr:PaaI family thioesterase [Actinomycetota bacterium]
MSDLQPVKLQPVELDEVRAFFKGDRFATEVCGAVIEMAHKDYARCSFVITPEHLNANGSIVGGAIFTLADFALAVASNVGEPPTVSVSSHIDFMSSAKGKRLIAEAHADKSGSTLGFYRVDVSDELGTKVAKMEAVCLKKKQTAPFGPYERV